MLSGHGVFDEIVESDDPLISSAEAQLRVEEMRERGLSYREIARLAGLSIESIHRSASGVGRIRQSTEDALMQVRSGTNGHLRPHGR